VYFNRIFLRDGSLLPNVAGPRVTYPPSLPPPSRRACLHHGATISFQSSSSSYDLT